MRQIAEGAQSIADPHRGCRSECRWRQWPMNDDASRAAAHRVTDKAMGVMALAFKATKIELRLTSFESVTISP